jgi:hypothetical protein
MTPEEEIERLRRTVAALRRSRTLLLRLLEESLQAQAQLQARHRADPEVSNVRQLAPRSAQDKGLGS